VTTAVQRMPASGTVVRNVVVATALTTGSVLGGTAVAHEYGIPVLGLTVFLGVVALAIYNWRWAMVGLLVYMPFSGLPIIALYPYTTVPVLIKDFLFVLPAYLGFLAFCNSRGITVSFRGAPVVLFVMLALLVLGQALNPELPNHLVGAIGIKVWLLYIPFYFLGYHLFRNKVELRQLFGLMSVVALPAIVLGIIEALLVNGGHANLVYRFYGNAASATTQNFAQFDLGSGGSIRRVSSTFSFGAQYYAFAVSMIAVSYGWLRSHASHEYKFVIGRAIWLLAIAAALTSGLRGAIVFVPLLILLIALFERGRLPSVVGRLLAPAAVLVAAVSVFHSGVRVLISNVVHVGRQEFVGVFVHGFGRAFHLTLTGVGTGADTSASRYAFTQPSGFTGVAGTWYESWYVKAALELGIAGLILVAFILAVILIRAWRAHRTLRDPGLRGVSAALLAFLVWNLVYAIKGQYMDFDPINVYFWLFAGILMKLPALERVKPDEPQ
jgi:hypothetical protein